MKEVSYFSLGYASDVEEQLHSPLSCCGSALCSRKGMDIYNCGGRPDYLLLLVFHGLCASSTSFYQPQTSTTTTTAKKLY